MQIAPRNCSLRAQITFSKIFIPIPFFFLFLLCKFSQYVVLSQSKQLRLAERLPAPAEVKRSHGAEEATAASTSAAGDEAAAEPVFGTVSVSGRSRYMEDGVAVRTAISRPEITEQRPVHFFAVYDGHGGHHVAELCKERLQVIVEEEMGRARGGESEEEGARWWRRVMERSFERMDEEANTCACRCVGNECSCQAAEAATGGSTAVVAVLTPDHVMVANVGDSRAVLCRGGLVLPLSDDHKPDRTDEFARIQAAGGHVINFTNGARVEGILAMSRAIGGLVLLRTSERPFLYKHHAFLKLGGDKYLKPYVISKPEITFTKREQEDECLIIASDGLWDVMSNELACEVACQCLREGISAPSTSTSVVDPNTSTSNLEPQREDERAGALMYPSRCALAATLLTRLALGRRSAENISVIVVDLKQS